MNKYSGGSFDDFLVDEDIFEEVTERALKRLLGLEIADMVNQAALNGIPFFEKINTDFVELNYYLFDPDNTVITSELLKDLSLEMKEVDLVQLNETLFGSEELLDGLLTNEIAA